MLICKGSQLSIHFTTRDLLTSVENGSCQESAILWVALTDEGSWVEKLRGELFFIHCDIFRHTSGYQRSLALSDQVKSWEWNEIST